MDREFLNSYRKGIRMAKKIKSECGWTVYHFDERELLKLIQNDYFGGICDECGKFLSNVFYVPVLNHGMCGQCFDDWNKRAEFYSEDLMYESKLVQWIENACAELMIDIIDLSKDDEKTMTN